MPRCIFVCVTHGRFSATALETTLGRAQREAQLLREENARLQALIKYAARLSAWCLRRAQKRCAT